MYLLLYTMQPSCDLKPQCHAWWVFIAAFLATRLWHLCKLTVELSSLSQPKFWNFGKKWENNFLGLAFFLGTHVHVVSCDLTLCVGMTKFGLGVRGSILCVFPSSNVFRLRKETKLGAARISVRSLYCKWRGLCCLVIDPLKTQKHFKNQFGEKRNSWTQLLLHLITVITVDK